MLCSLQEYSDLRDQFDQAIAEEENAIMEDMREALPSGVYRHRDQPEGTIITDPYYTEINVLVNLK